MAVGKALIIAKDFEEARPVRRRLEAAHQWCLSCDVVAMCSVLSVCILLRWPAKTPTSCAVAYQQPSARHARRRGTAACEDCSAAASSGNMLMSRYGDENKTWSDKPSLAPSVSQKDCPGAKQRHERKCWRSEADPAKTKMVWHRLHKTKQRSTMQISCSITSRRLFRTSATENEAWADVEDKHDPRCS